MSVVKSPIPSWTAKERVYAVFAFIAAGFAGYGVIKLLGRFDPLTPLVAIVMFVAAFALMAKGIDAIQMERFKKELEDRVRPQTPRRPGAESR
jgi:hypothetical protein